MSKINCPECGCLISDSVNKCPKCRFPLGKFTGPKQINDENIYEFRGNISGQFGSEVTYSSQRKMMFDKKLKLYVCIAAAVLIIIVVAAALFLNFNRNINRTADVLDIQEIKMGRIMKLNGKYVVKLTSNETRPFVSIVKNPNSDDGLLYNYVYMNGGKGEISFNYMENEKTKPDVVGYFEGYSLSANDIADVHTEYEYYDYNTTYKSACTVDFEITLNNKVSGILFYDVNCDADHTNEYNRSVVIVDGVGSGSCILDGLTMDNASPEPKIAPLYFVPAEELDGGDYVISEPFLMHISDFYDYSDKYFSYYIYGDIRMNKVNRGIVLYNYSLSRKNAGDSIETKNALAYVVNGECSVFSSSSIKNNYINDEPDYSVNISSYIDWKDLPKKTEEKNK